MGVVDALMGGWSDTRLAHFGGSFGGDWGDGGG